MSQRSEVSGAKHRWLAELLAAGEPRNFRTTLDRGDVFDVVAAGGYPAALRRATPAQRTRWFASYLVTVTDGDLPDLVDVRHSGALSRLYRLIARRTSSMAVNTELSQALDVAQPTASTYRRLLERLYLTTELPGWTAGVSAKPGHRAKVHVTDTGLAAGVLSLSAHRLATAAMGGAFLESFVVAELTRQGTTIDEALTFAHFRDRSGVEVDIIIERPDGSVVAIEVKSARSVNQRDASGLTFLRDRLGDRFQCGILFHTGPLTARLGERVWAVPVAALWDGTAGVASSSRDDRSVMASGQDERSRRLGRTKRDVAARARTRGATISGVERGDPHVRTATAGRRQIAGPDRRCRRYSADGPHHGDRP